MPFKICKIKKIVFYHTNTVNLQVLIHVFVLSYLFYCLILFPSVVLSSEHHSLIKKFLFSLLDCNLAFIPEDLKINGKSLILDLKMFSSMVSLKNKKR